NLALQQVPRHSSGRYACSALNAEGETVSNELHFRVKCEWHRTELGAAAPAAAQL
ncbi:hypothetical protein ABMA28_013916, partial [Loxostege sticticalis]